MRRGSLDNPPNKDYNVYALEDGKMVKQNKHPLTKWGASSKAARIILNGGTPMIKQISTGNWVG